MSEVAARLPDSFLLLDLVKRTAPQAGGTLHNAVALPCCEYVFSHSKLVGIKLTKPGCDWQPLGLKKVLNRDVKDNTSSSIIKLRYRIVLIGKQNKNV